MRHQYVEETKHRSNLRLALGKTYYSLRRYSQWPNYRPFAETFEEEPLKYEQFSHRTPLYRQLRDVDMELQLNKVTNLNLAVPRLNGLLLRPGETLSYWKAIGRPTARKGYVPGMVLTGGRVSTEVGGGLCQLSNLIYWMTLHTPLTVIERHHHGYDVFPDANRTQPFGSGAICYYPYVDLMIRNDTQQTFQLLLHVGLEYLEGSWRTDLPPLYRYEIVERDHEMRAEYWGGFSRHNALYRLVWPANDAAANSAAGVMTDASAAVRERSLRDREPESTNTEASLHAEDPLAEEFVTENHVLMMYSPFLESS